jgi:hypothetical protein
MAFEKYVLPNDPESPGQPKLNIHMFRGVLEEYLDGYRTKAECREVVEDQLGVTVSEDEKDDVVDTLDYIEGGSNLSQKMNRMDRVYRVLILAEAGTSWFDTRAELRDRLNWRDDTSSSSSQSSESSESSESVV